MESSNLMYLQNIDGESNNFHIRVKILRLWKKKNQKNPSEVWTIEMIIMDERGTIMQASVWKTYFPKHEKVLKQDECYIIYKVQFASNRQAFKQFDNNNIFNFNWETIVRKCNDFTCQANGFHLCSFNSLKDENMKPEFRIDFIGYDEEWYKREHTTTKAGKDSFKMSLKLRDLEGTEVVCTLWEEYCEEMEEFISKNKDHVHVVLLVQFGSYHIYKGKVNVSNAFGATRLFINSDIDEINSFRSSYLAKTCVETSSSHRSIGSSGVVSVEDEFLKANRFQPIGHLYEISEKMSVIIVGTILSVNKYDDWYYLGCDHCNRKVVPLYIFEEDEETSDGNDLKKVLVCSNPNCKKQVDSPVPIFRITLRVQDCTGTANLTLFDREAVKLLRKSANQLLEKYRQALSEGLINSNESIPVEFDSFINKKYAFKIQVSNFNLDKKQDGYAIHKVMSNEKIIAELEKRFVVPEVEESYAQNLQSIELSSQSDIASKDSISFTAENVTPVSVNTERGKKPSSELKRTLEDNYELEDSSSLSSSKSCKSDGKDDAKAGSKMTLLIPKVEK